MTHRYNSGHIPIKVISLPSLRPIDTIAVAGTPPYAFKKHNIPARLIYARLKSTPSLAAAIMAYNGSAFPTDVLNSTNYFRELHGAKDVTWNSSLAEYAQSYAQNCIWRHSVWNHPRASHPFIQHTNSICRVVPTARISQPALRPRQRRLTLGATKSQCIITWIQASPRRQATSPSWFGNPPPRSAVGQYCVITMQPAASMDGTWFASTTRLEM